MDISQITFRKGVEEFGFTECRTIEIAFERPLVPGGGGISKGICSIAINLPLLTLYEY